MDGSTPPPGGVEGTPGPRGLTTAHRRRLVRALTMERYGPLYLIEHERHAQPTPPPPWDCYISMAPDYLRRRRILAAALRREAHDG